MVEQMKTVLNDWWDRKTSDEEFFGQMSILLLQQRELDRLNCLKTMEISEKLENLVQKISQRKRFH